MLARPCEAAEDPSRPGADQNLGLSAAHATAVLTNSARLNSKSTISYFENSVFTTITTDARSDASKCCFDEIRQTNPGHRDPVFLSFHPHRDLTNVYQSTEFNVASLFVFAVFDMLLRIICFAVQSLQHTLW